MKQWPILRDVVLFFGGLGGVIHETAFTKAERPTLLILFAAMMGLPAFLRPNEVNKDAGTRQKELPRESEEEEKR